MLLVMPLRRSPDHKGLVVSCGAAWEYEKGCQEAREGSGVCERKCGGMFEGRARDGSSQIGESTLERQVCAWRPHSTLSLRVEDNFGGSDCLKDNTERSQSPALALPQHLLPCVRIQQTLTLP